MNKDNQHKWVNAIGVNPLTYQFNQVTAAGSFCIVCGLKRELHGTHGTLRVWYINEQENAYGWEEQPCIDKSSNKTEKK